MNETPKSKLYEVFCIYFLFVLTFTAVYPQDSVEVKNYYPQAGDRGITLDAGPFINLVGNLVRIAG